MCGLTNQKAEQWCKSCCVPYSMHSFLHLSVLDILNWLGNRSKTIVASSILRRIRECSLVKPYGENLFCCVWISMCLVTSIKTWVNHVTLREVDWVPDYSHPLSCKSQVTVAEWLMHLAAKQEVCGSKFNVAPLLKHACEESDRLLCWPYTPAKVSHQKWISRNVYITYTSAKCE